jgi:hypothetical protein
MAVVIRACSHYWPCFVCASACIALCIILARENSGDGMLCMWVSGICLHIRCSCIMQGVLTQFILRTDSKSCCMLIRCWSKFAPGTFHFLEVAIVTFFCLSSCKYSVGVWVCVCVCVPLDEAYVKKPTILNLIEKMIKK